MTLPRKRVAGLSIAHVVDEGAWGGLATFLANLILSQASDEKIGEIHLIGDLDQMEPALRQMPVFFHDYRSNRRLKKALGVSAAIGKHLRSIRPDIVILHSSFPGFWGRLIRRPSWKIVYCAHGWAFSQHVGAVKRSLYRLAERLLSRHTDAIVSISGAEFRAGEDAGIRPDLHKMIGHGLMPAIAVRCEVLPVSPDAINLLFIGRFDRQKGLDILLDALDDPKLAHITLWVVGRNIIGAGIDVPERSNVRLLGWIQNDQIDGIIVQMDAVIVPSRWEGFGLVALEAMRNSRPVIASSVGGLAEIVEDGLNGRILDISDLEQIRHVLKDLRKPDLERMGKSAFAMFQKKYVWSRCYDDWRALIAKISG